VTWEYGYVSLDDTSQWLLVTQAVIFFVIFSCLGVGEGMTEYGACKDEDQCAIGETIFKLTNWKVDWTFNEVLLAKI